MRSRVENLAEIFMIISSFFLSFPYISHGKNSHATTTFLSMRRDEELRPECGVVGVSFFTLPSAFTCSHGN